MFAAINSFQTAGGPVTGQQAYTYYGTYSWVAPAGVTKVSVVAVGGGNSGASGAGSALGYKNNYTVVPGSSYSVVVGWGGVSANVSYFVTSATVSGNSNPIAYTGDGGALGQASPRNGAGGGAGGYSGAGNSGTGGSGGTQCGSYSASCPGPGTYAGWGGGGVGILGQGASATSGTRNGGSGGASGGYGSVGFTCVCFCGSPFSLGYAQGGTGGDYGGGGGIATGGIAYNNNGFGGAGAVRIIWPGCARLFPSTRTANE